MLADLVTSAHSIRHSDRVSSRVCRQYQRAVRLHCEMDPSDSRIHGAQPCGCPRAVRLVQHDTNATVPQSQLAIFSDRCHFVSGLCGPSCLPRGGQIARSLGPHGHCSLKPKNQTLDSQFQSFAVVGQQLPGSRIICHPMSPALGDLCMLLIELLSGRVNRPAQPHT